MHRSYNGENIEVRFDCQDEASEMDSYNEGEGEEEGEYNHSTLGLNFEILISKGNKQVLSVYWNKIK
jgi:hypothetical protein